MKWKPMHTAPKDGAPVLLLIEGRAIEGYWEDRWDPKWHVVSLDSHGCGCCSRDNEDPTGWCPLPAQPQT